MENRSLVYYFSKVVCILIISFIFIFVGCSRQSENSFSHRKLGISFDFPEGWSHLQPYERKEAFSEKDTINIGDPRRIALIGFSEIKLEKGAIETYDFWSDIVQAMMPEGLSSKLDINQQESLGYLASVLLSIKMALPKRHTNYKLLHYGITTFAGNPVGEIIYEGRRPEDEETRWRRLLIIFRPRLKDRVYLLGFGVPVIEKEKYLQDFQYIESSWQWRRKFK